MNTSTVLLDKLWEKGIKFLGTKYAIMCGAMSWVSEHNLVSAVSNAGGFGVLACGSLNVDQLRNEIQQTKEKTSKPFGVNLITMHPDISKLIDMCLQENVGHIILAGGLPKASMIQKIKLGGAKVLCFAPSLGLAERLVKNGVDALIIEGMEAGGHIGPVSTSVLVQEILLNIKQIPVFVAGGIGRGEVILNYLRMGAAGCQLGTRFVCAYESKAHPNFKEVFIKSSSRAAVTSIQVDASFPVIPVRAIANKATNDFLKVQVDSIEKYKNGELSKLDAQLAIEKFWAGALKKAVIDGDIDNGSLMAGQSVGLITKEQSTEEIITELVEQALACLETV
ncbi:MAG: nitronate monooxygenase [Rickettsiales bacterium]|nr:nitronate monooxygenase [Rickettsiales bacterium]